MIGQGAPHQPAVRAGGGSGQDRRGGLARRRVLPAKHRDGLLLFFLFIELDRRRRRERKLRAAGPAFGCGRERGARQYRRSGGEGRGGSGRRVKRRGGRMRLHFQPVDAVDQLKQRLGDALQAILRGAVGLRMLRAEFGELSLKPRRFRIARQQQLQRVARVVALRCQLMQHAVELRPRPQGSVDSVEPIVQSSDLARQRRLRLRRQLLVDAAPKFVQSRGRGGVRVGVRRFGLTPLHLVDVQRHRRLPVDLLAELFDETLQRRQIRAGRSRVDSLANFGDGFRERLVGVRLGVEVAKPRLRARAARARCRCSRRPEGGRRGDGAQPAGRPWPRDARSPRASPLRARRSRLASAGSASGPACR